MTGHQLRRIGGPLRYLVFFGLAISSMILSNVWLLLAAPIAVAFISFAMWLWSTAIDDADARRQRDRRSQP